MDDGKIVLQVEVDAELAARAREARAGRWREDNVEAVRISNEELERNGLWSDGYRLF